MPSIYLQTDRGRPAADDDISAPYLSGLNNVQKLEVVKRYKHTKNKLLAKRSRVCKIATQDAFDAEFYEPAQLRTLDEIVITDNSSYRAN